MGSVGDSSLIGVFRKFPRSLRQGSTAPETEIKDNNDATFLGKLYLLRAEISDKTFDKCTQVQAGPTQRLRRPSINGHLQNKTTPQGFPGVRGISVFERSYSWRLLAHFAKMYQVGFICSHEMTSSHSDPITKLGRVKR